MKFAGNRQYWEFAARLGVSTAVLGSAFALGSVSVFSVRTLLNQREMREADRTATILLEKQNILTPVEKQIEDHETALGQMKDQVAREQTQKKLAGLYSQLAKKSAVLHDFPRTEMAYQKAIDLDPGNPLYLADLAALYADRARRQGDVSMRVTLYRSSRQYYRKAWRQARQPEVAQAYVNNAGATTLNLAKDLMATGRRLEVTEIAKDSATWATPEVIRQLNLMLQR